MKAGPAGPEVMEPLELLVLDRSAPAGQNTDVEVGPAGPKIMEPLELLVLDRADPAGQHAVIRNTTRWLEHQLAWPESSLPDLRPVEGVTEKIPMEGTAYPEHSARGASLDSGLRAGISSIEPVRQSVLNTCFKSSARPMLDPAMAIYTDLPEKSAPMINTDSRLSNDRTKSENWPPSESGNKSDPLISEGQDYYETGHSSPELEDAIRREVIRNRSMRYMSSHEVVGHLLLPEYTNWRDADMSLDQIHSEGLRQWNMEMDIEYQYETFNGLPVYYGGDMYDSDDTEEFDSDVPTGMGDMKHAERPPEGGDSRV